MLDNDIQPQRNETFYKFKIVKNFSKMVNDINSDKSGE